MDEKTPLLTWNFPEFIQHQRSRGWYVMFFVVILSLIAVGFFSRNYTFIAVILMATIVLVLRFRRTPHDVTLAITEKGLDVGGRLYEWSELKDFWITYKPPEIKQLYFSFKRPMRPDMNINLVNQNPLKVREVLREFLLENIEREEEPASEQLSRYFKI